MCVVSLILFVCVCVHERDVCGEFDSIRLSVCVCVQERERDVCMCVCVCVCVCHCMCVCVCGEFDSICLSVCVSSLSACSSNQEVSHDKLKGI